MQFKVTLTISFISLSVFHSPVLSWRWILRIEQKYYFKRYIFFSIPWFGSYTHIHSTRCTCSFQIFKNKVQRECIVNFPHFIKSVFCKYSKVLQTTRICEFRRVATAPGISDLPCMLLQIKFLTQYYCFLCYRNLEELYWILLLEVYVPENGSLLL